MVFNVNTEFLKDFVSGEEMKAWEKKAVSAAEKLEANIEKKDMPVGWTTLPDRYETEEYARIKKAAEKIRKDSGALVVIGIGGSYLGARAAIEFIQGEDHNAVGGVKVFFAGNSIDSDSLYGIIKQCEGVDISVNVISKSGTTTEPAIAFRVFRKILEDRYGKEGARERIYVTTDKTPKPGNLRDFAEKEGYETFVVPDDIGGRYSVLSSVGLLPIAAAGIDIDKIMEGAKKARRDNAACGYSSAAVKYAAIRNVLYSKGKNVEVFGSFSASLRYTGEWLKQLFAESEGKEGKGIFPASVVYSTDLHSVGQYIQQGQRLLFQTIIDVREPKHRITIPQSAENIDGIGYIEGKTLDFVNRKALIGTMYAHRDGGVPNVIIELEKADEEHFGYMVYFFEKACAVSGYILGINPFDQPGVEAYKKNMFSLLGKPGYPEFVF